MKNKLTVDFVKGQIIMDRTFAKLAMNTHTEEYVHLQQVRRDYPTYQVKVREIKKNEEKETYKGLTYEYMFNYISSHGNEEDIKGLKEMILISECHRQGHRYPTIKNWFLGKYPEVKKFWIEKKKSENPEADTTNTNIFAAGECNKKAA